MLQVKTGKIKKTSKRTRNALFIGNIVKDINDKTVWLGLLISMSSVNNGLSHFLGSQTNLPVINSLHENKINSTNILF